MRTMKSAALGLLSLAPTVCGFTRGSVASHSRRMTARHAESYDVTVDLPDGTSVTFPCADDEFILDAAEEAGFELPASCRSGGRAASLFARDGRLSPSGAGDARNSLAARSAGACTVCQGRVTSGEIEHDDQSTLDEEQLAVGYTCRETAPFGRTDRIFVRTQPPRPAGTCVAYPASDVRITTHQMDNFEAGVMAFDGDAAAAAPEAPAPVEAPAPAPAPAPEPAPLAAVAEPAAASTEIWQYKMKVAEQTLGMLKEVVAGRPELVAKCEEMAELLQNPDHNGAAAVAPEATGPAPEYTPFYSKDTGYTIWLNKNNPRNSYYEYDSKKK